MRISFDLDEVLFVDPRLSRCRAGCTECSSRKDFAKGL